MALDQETRQDPAPLAPRELGRWMWRQLTSMRTALVLLFLLALAAIPGSVIPQDSVDAVAASDWRAQHEGLTPLYEKLGLFSVYTSVWFSAIYLLLVISLVGCILPRTAVYWRGLRARPPKAPRRLERLSEHRRFATDDAPDEVLSRARAALRGYRIESGDGVLAAEKGYLREAGNLLFHISVLVVLAGVAIGSLFGFRGGVIVVTGSGFSNVLTQYDDFAPGRLFDPDSLNPFSLDVGDFDVTFIREGRAAGSAHKFSAGVDYVPSPGEEERHARISVNHPLDLDGTKVYLISHGYAPRLTIRDANGEVVSSGPSVFLPQDSTFRSFGVVKVPDSRTEDGERLQLALEGELYPTYAFTDASGPFSAFPDLRNPAISMLVYTGDLGLDEGRPQSVYAIDKSGLDRVDKPGGGMFRVDLPVGESVELPDGLGSVTFDGVDRFVKLQVSRSPADWLALLGVCLALLGLLGSLFIRPRRVWVRARTEAGRTLVEVAGLDRSSGGDLGSEIDRITTRARGTATPDEGDA